MAAAERRTFFLLGCLVLLLSLQTAESSGYDGRRHTRRTKAMGEAEATADYCSTGGRHQPAREVCCPQAESTNDFGSVDWPTTRVNTWASVACPYDDDPGKKEPKAWRRCIQDSRRLPMWGASNYSQCSTKGGAEQDAADAASSAENITSDPSKIDSAAFQEATNLIAAAQGLAKTNRTVARSMLKAVSNLVAASPSVQEASDADGSQRRKLFQILETHSRDVRLRDDEYPYEHRLPNLHLAVYRVDAQQDAMPDMEFRADYDGHMGDVSVLMPTEAVEQAMAASNVTRQQGVRLRYMALRNAELLVPPGALSAGQQLVTVTMGLGPRGNETEAQGQDMPVSGLRQPVRITFPMTADSMGTAHICGYEAGKEGLPLRFSTETKSILHDDAVPAAAEWRTDGLTTSIDGLTVVCESTHLTPFTLLLDPAPRRDLAGMELPLTVVGSLGSVLSVLGLALTIITYRFFGRISVAKASIRRAAPPRSPQDTGFSQDRWGRVLVQLCLALLLLHLAYLASNLKGVVPPPGCVAVAVLLHTFLLASFSWMFIEALLLYQILVTVFRTAETKFILKRLLFGWGVPILFVATNAAIGPEYYLDTHPDYCLTSGSNQLQHLLATIVPCGVVLAANVAIFVRVCAVLLRQRKVPGVRQGDDDHPKVTWAQVRGVIGVVFLLGITWPLSPLAANETILGLVSSGLNAFQGVAIFVSRVLNHPEARRCWAQRFCRGTTDFGSRATYPVNEKGSSWFRVRWASSDKAVASQPKDRRSAFKGANFSSSSSSGSSGFIWSRSSSDTAIMY